MTDSPTYQTDLEVILEFLEEHCRQESRRKEFWENNHSHLNESIDGEVCNNASNHLDSLLVLSASNTQQDTGAQLKVNVPNSTVAFVRRDSAIPSASPEQTVDFFAASESTLLQRMSCENNAESLPASTPAGRGKKVRLFHFLFEMLEDPRMSHCVSWVPASAGVFRFSSAHKEHVAELWGRRKGNRRPMTYQKMSRALRNYTRSGEIIKVRKKLTYQFSCTTLTTLQSQRGRKSCLS